MATTSSAPMDTKENIALKDIKWKGQHYKDVMASYRHLNIIYKVLMNRAHENKNGCELVAKGPDILKLWEDFCRWYGACFVGNGVATVNHNKFSEVTNELLKTRLNQSYADAKQLYNAKEREYSSDAVRKKRNPDSFLYFLAYDNNSKDTLYVTLDVNKDKWTVKPGFADPVSYDLKNADIPAEKLIPLQINAFPGSLDNPKDYNWLSDKNPDQLYKEIEKCFALYFYINTEKLVENLRQSTDRDNILWQQPYFRELYSHFVGSDKQIRELQSQVTAKEQQIQNLSDRVQTLTTNLSQVSRELDETLSAANAHFQQMNGAGLALFEQLKQLAIADQNEWKEKATNYGNRLEAATKALSERFQQLEKQNADQQSTLDAKDQEIAVLKGQTRAANENEKQLQRTVVEVTAGIKKVLNTVFQPAGGLNKQDGEITALIERLENKDVNEICNTIKQIISAMINKGSAFQEQIAQLTREKNNFQGQLVQAQERLQLFQTDSEKQINFLNNRVVELQGQLAACQDEKSKLQKERVAALNPTYGTVSKAIPHEKEAKRDVQPLASSTPEQGRAPPADVWPRDHTPELAEKDVAALRQKLTEFTEIQTRSEKQRSEIENLQVQLRAAEEATRQKESKLAQQLRAHQEALAASQTQVTQLTDQLEQQTAQYAAELEREKTKNERKISETKAELTQIKADLEERKKELEENQGLLRTQTQEYNEYKAFAQPLLKDVYKKLFPKRTSMDPFSPEVMRSMQRELKLQTTTEAAQVRQRIETLFTTIGRLQKNVEDSKRQVDEQKTQTDAVDRRRQIHETLLAGLQEQRTAFRRKEQTLAELLNTTQAFIGLLATAYKEQQTLNKQLIADLETTRRSLQTMKTQRDEARKRSKEYLARNQQLLAQLAEQKVQLEDIRQQREENWKTLNELKDSDSATRALLDSKHAELEQLTQKLRENQSFTAKALSEISTALNEGKQDQTTDVPSVDKIKAVIKQIQSKDKDAKAAIERFTAEQRVLLRTLNELQQDGKQMKEKRRVLQQESDAAKRQADAIQQRIWVLNNEQKELEEKKNDTVASMQLVLANRRSLEAAYLEQVQQNVALNNQLEDAKNAATHHDQATAALRAQVQAKESQLETMRAQVAIDQGRIDSQTTELEKTKRRLDDVRATLFDHDAKLREMLTTHSAQGTELALRSATFDRNVHSAALDQALVGYENDKKAWETQQTELTALRESIARTLEAQKNELARLQAENDQQREELTRMRNERAFMKQKMESAVQQPVTDFVTFLKLYETKWETKERELIENNRFVLETEKKKTLDAEAALEAKERELTETKAREEQALQHFEQTQADRVQENRYVHQLQLDYKDLRTKSQKEQKALRDTADALFGRYIQSIHSTNTDEKSRSAVTKKQELGSRVSPNEEIRDLVAFYAQEIQNYQCFDERLLFEDEKAQKDLPDLYKRYVEVMKDLKDRMYNLEDWAGICYSNNVPDKSYFEADSLGEAKSGESRYLILYTMHVQMMTRRIYLSNDDKTLPSGFFTTGGNKDGLIGFVINHVKKQPFLTEPTYVDLQKLLSQGLPLYFHEKVKFLQPDIILGSKPFNDTSSDEKLERKERRQQAPPAYTEEDEQSGAGGAEQKFLVTTPHEAPPAYTEEGEQPGAGGAGQVDEITTTLEFRTVLNSENYEALKVRVTTYDNSIQSLPQGLQFDANQTKGVKDLGFKDFLDRLSSEDKNIIQRWDFRGHVITELAKTYTNLIEMIRLAVHTIARRYYIRSIVNPILVSPRDDVNRMYTAGEFTTLGRLSLSVDTLQRDLTLSRMIASFQLDFFRTYLLQPLQVDELSALGNKLQNNRVISNVLQPHELTFLAYHTVQAKEAFDKARSLPSLDLKGVHERQARNVQLLEGRLGAGEFIKEWDEKGLRRTIRIDILRDKIHEAKTDPTFGGYATALIKLPGVEYHRVFKGGDVLVFYLLVYLSGSNDQSLTPVQVVRLHLQSFARRYYVRHKIGSAEYKNPIQEITELYTTQAFLNTGRITVDDSSIERDKKIAAKMTGLLDQLYNDGPLKSEELENMHRLASTDRKDTASHEYVLQADEVVLLKIAREAEGQANFSTYINRLDDDAKRAGALQYVDQYNDRKKQYKPITNLLWDNQIVNPLKAAGFGPFISQASQHISWGNDPDYIGHVVKMRPVTHLQYLRLLVHTIARRYYIHIISSQFTKSETVSNVYNSHVFAAHRYLDLSEATVVRDIVLSNELARLNKEDPLFTRPLTANELLNAMQYRTKLLLQDHERVFIFQFKLGNRSVGAGGYNPFNAAEPSRQYAPTWSQAIEMGLHGDSDVGVAFSPEEIARAILDPESLRQNAHRRLVAVSKDSNILEKQPHLTPLEYKTYKSQLDFIEGLTPEATRSRLSGFETELWLYTLQESSPVSVVDVERTLATGRLVVVEGKLTQTYTSGLQVNVRTQALRPVLASLPAWLDDLYHPENHVLPLAALRPRSFFLV